MSDSVDRVFSHALNTVNKIRTGSEKPPATIRLKLYGLYKQSMEGDVEGIMERPEGLGEEAKRVREKWDAWKQQSGLSRTEAKRRYITTLIDTMHKYASTTPETRELVAELEFVWDQVRSNVPSSSSSSPLETLPSSIPGLSNNPPPTYPSFGSSTRSYAAAIPAPVTPSPHGRLPLMRNLSPVSVGEEEAEEFVDAQDSQYQPEVDLASSPDSQVPSHGSPSPSPKPARPSRLSSSAQWRKSVEAALIKMTTEVAALREQLETRRLFTPTAHKRRRVLEWAIWFFKTAARHLTIDALLLILLLLWLRWKMDRRLEEAVAGVASDTLGWVTSWVPRFPATLGAGWAFPWVPGMRSRLRRKRM